MDLFLFLGFWFKYSVILALNLGYGEGIDGLNEIITSQNFDDALVISIVGFLGFILFGHLREIYLNYPKIINTLDFSILYNKYRYLIIIIFACLIIAIPSLNFIFKFIKEV